MSFSVDSTSVPAPQVPAAMLNVGGNPTVGPAYATGTVLSVAKLNEGSARGDLVGRFGGGGYAVATGLDLTAPGSGLGLHVAAGQAMIDNIVEVSAATTVTVTNGVRSWIWLKQNGVPVPIATSTAPPAGACCLLGSCVASGGNITDVDFSGVVYLRGGALWRRTSDVGLPADTPPAGLILLTRTQGGLYLWDGTAYSTINTQNQLAALQDTVSPGVSVSVPTGAQLPIFDTLTVHGILTISGKVKVVSG